MSELVRVNKADITSLLAALRAADSLTDLTEARARIEAARAWAKVHGQVKEMRLDLLRVEVEALVRVVELGGLDSLPTKDRKSAQYLADMTREERAAFVANSGNVTTAAGLCRAVWVEEELAAERRFGFQRGKQFAETPDAPFGELVELARERVADVSAVLANVIETYAASDGQPFTVREMADEVIADAALGEVDPAVAEGVREVCRAALRSAPVVEIEGTRLPRTVTARDADGHFIRIPVENALLSHFDEMRALREEQLAQDRAALDVLDAIAAKLRAIAGATDESRIGDLVARSLKRGVA